VRHGIAVEETWVHHHGAETKRSQRSWPTQQSGSSVDQLAAALAHPPVETVKLVEPTSWAVVHGIERWRSNCGDRMNQDVPPHPWRARFRAAIDWLAAEILARIHEREGRDTGRAVGVSMAPAPWAVTGGEGGAADRDGARCAALHVPVRLVLRRHRRTREPQVLRYAAHAITLAGADSGRLGARFIETLGDARATIRRRAVRRRVPRNLRPAVMNEPLRFVFGVHQPVKFRAARPIIATCVGPSSAYDGRGLPAADPARVGTAARVARGP
jgi:hypothetical protein